MGSDIHSYVERRVLVPRVEDARLRLLEQEMITGGPRELEAWEGAHTISWTVCLDIALWDEHRNYELFAYLGGVRAWPQQRLLGWERGLPPGFTEDFSFYHSHTWYMCHDLMDVDNYVHPWTDVVALQQMMCDLVAKYGPRDVRITFAWDN